MPRRIPPFVRVHHRLCRRLRRRPVPWVAASLLLVLGAGPLVAAHAQSRPDRAAREAAREQQKAERAFDRTFAAAIRSELTAIVDEVAAGGSIQAASARADGVFDRVLAWGDPDDVELLRDAALARRLLAFTATLPAADRAPAAAFLARVPDAARRLAFLMRPEVDDVGAAMRVLARLAAVGGERLNDYPDLVAAICVVHDRPIRRRINESFVGGLDPVAVFEYFVRNERLLLNSPRRVPAELLLHVVDVTTSLDEMQWALDKYRRDADIGDRFFEIDYDTAHLRDGRPKAVTRLGLTLPNIKQHGGVCADQAYFAASVGKAIGVPANYVSGRSGSNAHAWVGFVRVDRSGTFWDFDAGRYEEYEFVRGLIEDPQSGERVPDSHVSTLVPVGQARPLDREIVVALCDAARRLEELDAAKDLEWPPAAGDGEDLAPVRDPRRPSVAVTLGQLRMAVDRVPSHLEPWRVVQELAEAGRMDLDARRVWADAAWTLCGPAWADLFVDIVGPMIDTIEEPGERTLLWDRVHELVAARPDLSAEIRMAQGAVWEAAGEPERALHCYQLVIGAHAGSGPPIQSAVREAMRVLRANGRPDLVLPMLADAWPRLTRPSGPRAIQFARADDWVIVGRLYEAELRAAGLGRDAMTVGRQIDSVVR